MPRSWVSDSNPPRHTRAPSSTRRALLPKSCTLLVSRVLGSKFSSSRVDLDSGMPPQCVFQHGVRHSNPLRAAHDVFLAAGPRWRASPTRPLEVKKMSHGPRLHVCQAPNAFICVSPNANSLRSLTFARFSRTFFNSLNWNSCLKSILV